MRLSQSAESAPPPRDPSRCAPRLPCPALSPSALPAPPHGLLPISPRVRMRRPGPLLGCALSRACILRSLPPQCPGSGCTHVVCRFVFPLPTTRRLFSFPSGSCSFSGSPSSSFVLRSSFVCSFPVPVVFSVLLAFSVRSPPSLVAMLCAVPSMRASTTSSVSLSGNVIGSQESRTRRSVRREARPSESEW